MMIERSGPVLFAALLASSSALGQGSYPPAQTTPPPPGSSAPAAAAPPSAPPATPPAAPATTPSATTTGGAASTTAPKIPTDDTPLIMVVPASIANDPTLANGCWARLYDRTNFRGDLLPVAGNVAIADTHATFVADYELGRNFDSLILGAHASLSVWDGTNFSSRKTIFGPGESISDLDSRMSDMQDIRSIRLTCTP